MNNNFELSGFLKSGEIYQLKLFEQAFLMIYLRTIVHDFNGFSRPQDAFLFYDLAFNKKRIFTREIIRDKRKFNKL